MGGHRLCFFPWIFSNIIHELCLMPFPPRKVCMVIESRAQSRPFVNFIFLGVSDFLRIHFDFLVQFPKQDVLLLDDQINNLSYSSTIRRCPVTSADNMRSFWQCFQGIWALLLLHLLSLWQVLPISSSLLSCCQSGRGLAGRGSWWKNGTFPPWNCPHTGDPHSNLIRKISRKRHCLRCRWHRT